MVGVLKCGWKDNGKKNIFIFGGVSVEVRGEEGGV